MRQMFYGCSGLTSLDVSSFDTKKVWSSKSMFENCSNLTSIDLSGFDASNIKYIEKMFKDCSKLKTISLGDKYTNIPREAYLPNGEGWVNANDPTTVISGEGDFLFPAYISKRRSRQCRTKKSSGFILLVPRMLSPRQT